MTEPTIRTYSNPKCFVCGTPGKPLHTGLKDRLFGAPGTWDLKQCPRPECGLVWPDPCPITEDLGLAYQTYYTHVEPATGSAGLVFQLAKWAYWTGIRIPAYLTGIYQERREFVQMFLRDRSPGRLFDAGCGDGQFLSLMKQHGWQGKGVDFDAAAIETGKKKYGVDLEVGDFQTIPIEESAFDAVTMSHVIEHVPDPIACLDKCRRLLKPGGRLVVSTPNVRSLGHQTFKSAWRGLEPPRHLHIFPHHLLGECARRAGLKVVKTGSTAVNADYIISATMAIANAPAGTSQIGGGWDARYALKAIAFQYREHFALRKNPDVGEEAYLVAERGT
ncbi:MAG TPA: class I SAM-dependent methyltransferase [Verrucomicrobiae bacterium]|nr:class I SAM-dependent methyltransferase [Verrucomicrobiae bacterium]